MGLFELLFCSFLAVMKRIVFNAEGSVCRSKHIYR